jgi:hypothetical protein
VKPSLPELARDLAARLRTDIVPELGGFRAGNVAMTAAIVDMIGERWDGMAARLFEENAAFRALLSRGGVRVSEGAMDLRISALEAENDRLRAALIDLHAAVEVRDDADARAIDTAIWAELARSVERRRISAANF